MGDDGKFSLTEQQTLFCEAEFQQYEMLFKDKQHLNSMECCELLARSDHQISIRRIVHVTTWEKKMLTSQVSTIIS